MLLVRTKMGMKKEDVHVSRRGSIPGQERRKDRIVQQLKKISLAPEKTLVIAVLCQLFSTEGGEMLKCFPDFIAFTKGQGPYIVKESHPVERLPIYYSIGAL